MRLKLTDYSVDFSYNRNKSENSRFRFHGRLGGPGSYLLWAACLGLSACGGGGGSSSAPVQASVTPPVAIDPPATVPPPVAVTPPAPVPPPATAAALASYPGTWYGPCAGRLQDMATVSPAEGGANALQLKLVRNFHAANGCEGTPIATETLSADFTLSYISTTSSAALLAAGAAVTQVPLDLVTISIPAYARTRSGPAVTETVENGVRRWCIAYADGPVCTNDTGLQAAANAPSALYLDKGDLVLLSPSGTAGYIADVRYTKERATTAQSQGPAFQRIDTVQGTGTLATSGRTLTVNYTGWLYDATKADFKGAQFDTSAGKTPFTFRLGAGSVIAGWDQGLLGMRAGGKRTLIIPASLGYGRTGSGTTIPPDAPLLFEVELISVQ
jgi:FKBP-type peptidyl-prolyl cis-trans isomerase FkpA